MAKARKIANLDGESSYAGAMARIIEARFDEMWAHKDGTILGRDPEELHDMRVGSRRLRAAMDVAVTCFPKRYSLFHSVVKELTDVLGGVRDCDVMREALLGYRDGRPTDERAAINRMLQALKVERDARRAELLTFFARLERERFEPRFRGFLAEHNYG